MRSNYVYVTPRREKPRVVSAHRFNSKAGADVHMIEVLTNYAYSYHPKVFQFAHDFNSIGRIYLN